jgi:glycosyl-4,4'-diaponeurosporenoate acyltransferase
MKLYLTVIGIAMLIISIFNIIFGTAAWYYIVIATVFCTALQFVIDGAIAIAINKMPDSWFGVDNPAYNVTERERKLYKKLKVKRWKDKVWELGGLGGFSKGAIASPNDPEYIEKFIIECNKGVLTHRIGYVAGFLAMLTLPMPLSLTIAMPVATVNLFLNILPTIVLRNNTPLLKSILKKLRARR